MHLGAEIGKRHNNSVTHVDNNTKSESDKIPFIPLFKTK